ncbi:ComEC/Rec2 family competence protein, partial [Clavibacter michiganensis]
RTDGMVVADAVVDEPPAPVASHAGSGAGRADRVRLAAHLTALHVGRDGDGRAVDDTMLLPSPVPVVVFATGSGGSDDGSGPDGRGRPRMGVGAVVRVSAAVRSADPADR